MNTITKLILLLILPFSSVLYASESGDNSKAIYLGWWSKHLLSEAENETHNFIAFEYNNYQIGGFTNSHNDYTIEATYNFNLYEINYFQFGVLAGLSYGYDPEDVDFMNYNGFMPIAVPYVVYIQYDVQPFVGLLGQAIFLSFKVEF